MRKQQKSALNPRAGHGKTRPLQVRGKNTDRGEAPQIFPKRKNPQTAKAAQAKQGAAAAAAQKTERAAANRAEHQALSALPSFSGLPSFHGAASSHGALPRERIPLILETRANKDYALLDSGEGRKLEQYGACRLIRPEGQALGLPNLPESEWAKADAIFTGNLEEEGLGRWLFPKAEARGAAALAETWPLQWDGLPYLGRFTSFRHVGVFPEQTAHWLFMEEKILAAKRQGRAVRVLNLFAYTGLASLIAARAGAEVVHIDASKKAIGWAQENQIFSGLGAAPIRFICEDALKFMAREQKRGNFYDIILLDPPAYGRGPKGEIWQFFDNIAELIGRARALLSPAPLAVILTAYSIRASFYALHALMRAAFRGMGGIVESGELILREQTDYTGEKHSGGDSGENAEGGREGRALSTSLFSRFIADEQGTCPARDKAAQ